MGKALVAFGHSDRVCFRDRRDSWGGAESGGRGAGAKRTPGGVWAGNVTRRVDADGDAQPVDGQRREDLCREQHRANLQARLYCWSKCVRRDFFRIRFLEVEAAEGSIETVANDLCFDTQLFNRVFRANLLP